MNVNISELCRTRPMSDPPVKFQSGDHHSPDPMSTISLLKFGNPETQGSSVEISGGNCSSPSTINTFYSASSRENSFEYINESTEAKHQDFKTPYTATNAETGNSLWSSFTRGIYRGSKKNKPEVALDLVADIPGESISESSRNAAATGIPETVNSAKKWNSSEVNLSNSETPRSNIILSQSGKPRCSNSSSQTGLSECENVERIDSQRTAQSSNFSPFTCQDHVANSTANFCPRSNQPEQPPTSAVPYPKGKIQNVYVCCLIHC